MWEEWKTFFVFLCFHAHITTYHSNFLFQNPYMIYFLCKITQDFFGQASWFWIFGNPSRFNFASLITPWLRFSQKLKEDKQVLVEIFYSFFSGPLFTIVRIDIKNCFVLCKISASHKLKNTERIWKVKDYWFYCCLKT